ncbi:hypothetical protein DN748_16280 [Sinomicrobium soli]|nr:hypothetical protein DN748_16280 [Sinomicrobium sp. N-1-3-6]
MATLFGCSDDDSSGTNANAPVADFSFTSNESTFSFTNLSENASSYRWDFGDLKFYSYEENPVYTYAIGGEIPVSLTVFNDSGESDMITKTIQAPEIIIIDIKIDGEFDEWEDVEVAAEKAEEGGSVQKMKFWAGETHLNFYFEGNTNMQLAIVDMYINSDGEATTGFLSSDWPENSGADYLFEGPVVNNGGGSFYEHADPNGGWAWNPIAGSASNLMVSGIVPIDENTNAIEFSIPKSQFGSLGKNIGFAITELNEGWGLVGNFPEGGSFILLDL